MSWDPGSGVINGGCPAACLQDMEVLLHAQKRAEKDPLGFVESLKNGVSLILWNKKKVLHPKTCACGVVEFHM